MERPAPQQGPEGNPEQDEARNRMFLTIMRKVIDVLGVDEDEAVLVVHPETVLGTAEGGDKDALVHTIGKVTVIQADSLDQVEFTSELEDTFDVQIADERLGEMLDSVPGVYKNGVSIGKLMDMIVELQES